MQQWEYLTILLSTGLVVGKYVHYYTPDGKRYKVEGDFEVTVHNLMNRFGKHGFELVSVATSSTNAGIYGRQYIMKRPKSADDGE